MTSKRFITYAGHTLSLPEWSRWLSIPLSTLRRRVQHFPYLSCEAILGVADKSYWRGHVTVSFASEPERSRYADDLTLTPAFGEPDGVERPCLGCGLVAAPWIEEEMPPDSCIGTLPGVQFACCGHGRHALRGDGAAYVILADGTRYDEAAALAYFASCGVWPGALVAPQEVL